MGRFKEAPLGYQCPYRDACPHLGGMSTTWISELTRDIEGDTFRDSHFIGMVEEENAALRSDNDRLERRTLSYGLV